MEQASQYAIRRSSRTRQTAVLGNSLLYVARRVLAILALLAFTYGLLAAEVELAKIEMMTAPAAR